MFGAIRITWSSAASRLVPRSDRKTYRAPRPRYGARRPRPIAARLQTFTPRAFAFRRRRCAPRLRVVPAMYQTPFGLVAHPAMRAEIERHFALQR